MNKALTINFCPSSEVCENSTQINDLNLVVGVLGSHELYWCLRNVASALYLQAVKFPCCFVLVQLNELWLLRLEVLENQDHGTLCQVAAAWKWELKIAGSESPGSCLLDNCLSRSVKQNCPDAPVVW